MSSSTIPLAVPVDLLGKVRSAAKRTGLSQADVMRQSIKLGLPKLLESLAGKELKPLTREESRRCYEKPNPDFDALESHCASLPQPLPEDD